VDNFFSTVAFRYAHTIIRSHIPRLDDNLKEISQGSLLIRNCIASPTSYYIPQSKHATIVQNGVLTGPPTVPVLRGIANNVAGKVEPAMVDDLRNFLFGFPSGNPSGGDLASLNIQRGSALVF